MKQLIESILEEKVKGLPMPASNCNMGYKDYTVNLAYFFLPTAYNIIKKNQKDQKEESVQENNT